jgi:hypothetical protein
MTPTSIDRVIRSIRKERERIWLHRSEDIGTLRKRIGSMKQNFTTIMYADTDTQSLVKYLYNLRETSKMKGVHLGTLKQAAILFLEFDRRRATVYYRLNITAKLLEKVIDAIKGVKSIKTYQTLIGELLLYIGKLNYWIDLEIPWSKLAKAFEKA